MLADGPRSGIRPRLRTHRYRLAVPNVLAAATAVRQRTPGCYDVTIDPGWSIGARPNGGYLMALIARAALRSSPHGDPLAVSASFLRPPTFGPATIEVEDLRVGRSVGFHAARLIAGGEVVVDARVTSGRLPRTDATWAESGPPALPPPDECPQARPVAPDGTHISLYENLELRYDPATVQWARPKFAHLSHDPVLRAWVRMRDTDACADPYAALLAADALPPTVFAIGVRGWSPTVEMTTYLRGRPAPGWLRVAVHTQLLAGGWFDEQAVVWDGEGRLVAQGRQLAMAGRQQPRPEEAPRADTDNR